MTGCKVYNEELNTKKTGPNIFYKDISRSRNVTLNQNRFINYLLGVVFKTV